MHRQFHDQGETVELDSGYDAVHRGRQFVTALAEAWGLASLADDASLVTSEIVSNAVIHARSPIELRVSCIGDGVRIEVRDSADYGIVRSPPGRPGEAPTSWGLGLRVVGELSRRWGVDPVPDGKMVWAEIGLSPPTGAHSAAPVTAVGPTPLPLPDDWPEVRLLAVPVRLLRSWEDHVRDLMREFALVSAGGRRRPMGGGNEAPVLAALERYWDLMRPVWVRARALGGPAWRRVTLEARLPERVVIDGPRFLEALDAADELGRRGHLLTDVATAEVRDFGRWFVHAVVRQVTAAPGDTSGERCPFLS